MVKVVSIVAFSGTGEAVAEQFSVTQRKIIYSMKESRRKVNVENSNHADTALLCQIVRLIRVC